MLLDKAETTLIVYPAASGSVTLNTITSIGMYAFSGCSSLTSVSLPAATSIGNSAFSYTGGTALTVTLGATAPTLGADLFENYVSVPKTVTVLVPSGATGYGSIPATYSGSDATGKWGNAFRGKGWNGTSYGAGTVNSNVTLKIDYIPGP
jgi:hypothetical protein